MLSGFMNHKLVTFNTNNRPDTHNMDTIDTAP